MPMVTERLHVETRGHGHIVDVTPAIANVVRTSRLEAGTATVFVTGSTAGVTTVEYEPGLVHDLTAAFERLFPRGIEYRHQERWGDDNGHSHLRASMLGPSLVVPFTGSKLCLGTWQQIVLIDFDTRPRSREYVVHLMAS